MHQDLRDLEYILTHGENRQDRTGVGTKSVFSLTSRYNLRKTFPAVTTKPLAWKAMVSELLWFIEGSTDERRLAEILHGTRDSNKKTIWSGNANADYWKPKAHFEGDLGKVYGYQWRNWESFNQLSKSEDDLVTGNYIHIDQLQNLIDNLKNKPHDRRHILSAWNPGQLDEMALPACHIMSQFYVNLHNELSCQMYQRSADFFLGVPFNIASYSLLTHIIAQVCGYKVGDFIHVVGDAHIYNNHIEQVETQLSRTPLALPTLNIDKSINNINNFTMNSFSLNNYNSLESIKALMAV